MAIIKLTDGKEMIARYKERRELILKENYDSSILTLSETFSKEEIVQILNQTGCENFRSYLGMDADNNIRLILVGVDADDHDLLENKIIIENGLRCPSVCPLTSALNE